MPPPVAPLSELLEMPRVVEWFNHFSALTGLAVRLTDAQGRTVAASDRDVAPQCPLCERVRERAEGCRRCAEDVVEAGREAQRWGTPFYFECWLGLIEWAVPVVVEDRLVGILVCGQALMTELDEVLRDEIERACVQLGLAEGDAREAMGAIAAIGPQRSRAAAEMLQLIADRLNRQGAGRREDRRRRIEEQRRIAEAIHGHKARAEGDAYPIQIERQLVTHVCLGEVARAKEILNDLLGAIFFRDMGHNEALKARLIELLTVLSRAAVEAGGDPEDILGANLEHLQQLSRGRSPEEMGGVVIQALNRFTDGVYRTRNTEQMRVLGRALAYIREHADAPISADDVARAIHKNASTLRKLMREQLGMTFSDYVNRMRVERAIEVMKDPGRSLAQVAVEVGFYDQSHFGKVFRQVTGYTPALYRKRAL